MYRLLLVIKLMESRQLNKAYRVLYNYYNERELYKGDYLRTLLLIDQYINGQLTINDLKRSINAFQNGKPSKFGCKFEDDGVLEDWMENNNYIGDIYWKYEDVDGTKIEEI